MSAAVCKRSFKLINCKVSRQKMGLVMQKSRASMSANEQMLAEDCRINRCRVMLVHKISRLCPFGTSAAERMQPANLSRL